MFENIEHLRKGQAIYCFLSWLADHPKTWKTTTWHSTTPTLPHDTFNMKDEDFDRYYEEWLKDLEKKEIETKLQKLARDGAASKDSMVSTVINGKRYTILKEDAVPCASDPSSSQGRTRLYR